MIKIVFFFFSTFAFAESFFSWEPASYVWSLGIALSCDIKADGDPFEVDPRSYIHPELLRDGDVVWIQARKMPIFMRDVFPYILSRIILVINDGDEAFPGEVLNPEQVKFLLSNKKIIHVFAQNCNYLGADQDKISPIPIGIDYHTVELRPEAFQEVHQSVKDQEQTLNDILSQLLPTHQRKLGAFLDFHLNDSSSHGKYGQSRGRVKDVLTSRRELEPFLEFADKRIPRRELWQRKGEYAFSISPHGGGLDCHRTWEDLLLGCIVIVKTSPLDSLYQGLPVVIVSNWEEVTLKNLQKWLVTYGDAFTNKKYREKLTHAYWMEKIFGLRGK